MAKWGKLADKAGGYYRSFLPAITNPKHKEHKDRLEWVGGRFNPDEFDITLINQRLRKIC